MNEKETVHLRNIAEMLGWMRVVNETPTLWLPGMFSWVTPCWESYGVGVWDIRSLDVQMTPDVLRWYHEPALLDFAGVDLAALGGTS